MGSVTSLLLGLDVSPRRLGWGLVDLVTGAAVACGCESIDLPDHGWQHQQVSRALGEIDPGGPEDFEIQAVYIEQPWLAPVSGTKSAYSAGRAVQSAHEACERRWPWAPIEYLHPQEWRKLAGIEHKGKPPIMARAVDLGFTPDVQDAADAAMVAYAGWRRNEEIIERAGEVT